MDSMTNVSENMEINTFGKCLQMSSNIYLYQLLFRIKFSVFMEDYLLKFKKSIKLKPLIEFKIFLIVDLSVIYCGLILLMMENLALEDHLEEQDFVGAKILVKNSIIETT